MREWIEEDCASQEVSNGTVFLKSLHLYPGLKRPTIIYHPTITYHVSLRGSTLWRGLGTEPPAIVSDLLRLASISAHGFRLCIENITQPAFTSPLHFQHSIRVCCSPRHASSSFTRNLLTLTCQVRVDVGLLLSVVYCHAFATFCLSPGSAPRP